MEMLLANRNLLDNLLNKNYEAYLQMPDLSKEYNKWTGEKREKMYENVLKFPEGTAHLDYFEKNPHQDRIPDKDLAMYELFNPNSSKTNELAEKFDFEQDGILAPIIGMICYFRREVLNG